MATTHTVRQGEHITRIARQYGFFDYRTVWDHPQNAALKKKRPSPNVLLPGDTLFIPDKQEKTEERAAGHAYRFRLAGQRLRLRLVLRDFDNKPIPNTPCVLHVEGEPYNVRTNGNGLMEIDLPAEAEQGVLTIPDLDLEVPLEIGHLDPVDQDSGWHARLLNLGYWAGPRGDSQADELRLHYAIEQFQRDYKLKVTGNLDQATKAQLLQAHGC